MGARDLLAELAGAGLTVEADSERLLIRPASKLTADLRAALQAAKPEVLALLAGRAAAPPQRTYGLSQADADAAHAEPWDEAACARFVARVGLFLRRGINATDADDLAERLHLRDVQADDRVMCIECRHLAGRPGAWGCASHRTARVGRELPRVLVTTLQRCPAFPTVGTSR